MTEKSRVWKQVQHQAQIQVVDQLAARVCHVEQLSARNQLTLEVNQQIRNQVDVQVYIRLNQEAK